MNLDLNAERKLEAKFEHEAYEQFKEDNKKAKIKYCKEKLNKVCENCDDVCDYKVEEIKKEDVL